MTYHLTIGDYAHSSWSLRGWLMFEHFEIERDLTLIDFNHPVAAQLAAYPPARTVPTLITGEGAVISDSLAMAEELANRHPDISFWPKAPKARAAARQVVAEMHAGFHALRNECPMNLRATYSDSSASEAVRGDLQRIETLWQYAQDHKTGDGPWLFGDYCLADVFYAPVAARIAGYSLPVGEDARAYVATHLADPAFRRWRALGLVMGEELDRYKKPFKRTVWPGPEPIPAKAITSRTALNKTCPYSGKPVTDLMEVNGHIFGMCNPICRDKTAADPEAWPAFMEIYHSVTNPA